MGLRTALLLASFAFALPAAAQEVDSGGSLRLGDRVEITEPHDGPLRAAGGEVRIDAPIHGSVGAAGGTLEIGPDAVIDENASMAGGTITVKGAVKGELRAVGGDVTLDGPVGGDASIGAGTLTLGPGARIAGKLTFRGGQIKQDPAAQVVGGITQRTGVRHRSHERTPAERFLRGWLWTAGLIALAALIAAALPGPSQRMAQELRVRPWLTPVLGLVAITAIPIAAVLVMITVIGIPIGLLALIGYAALMLVGYVWLAVVVGALLLDRIKPEVAAQTAWRVGAAMLAMLALGLLGRVPVLGGLVIFVALIAGVGMIVGAVLRHRDPVAQVG